MTVSKWITASVIVSLASTIALAQTASPTKPVNLNELAPLFDIQVEEYFRVKPAHILKLKESPDLVAKKVNDDPCYARIARALLVESKSADYLEARAELLRISPGLKLAPVHLSFHSIESTETKYTGLDLGGRTTSREVPWRVRGAVLASAYNYGSLNPREEEIIKTPAAVACQPDPKFLTDFVKAEIETRKREIAKEEKELALINTRALTQMNQVLDAMTLNGVNRRASDLMIEVENGFHKPKAEGSSSDGAGE